MVSTYFLLSDHVLVAPITRNRSHNEIAFTSVYKGEKQKINDFFILSHAFGLKLSQMRLDGIINCCEMFWLQPDVPEGLYPLE